MRHYHFPFHHLCLSAHRGRARVNRQLPAQREKSENGIVENLVRSWARQTRQEDMAPKMCKKCFQVGACQQWMLLLLMLVAAGRGAAAQKRGGVDGTTKKCKNSIHSWKSRRAVPTCGYVQQTRRQASRQPAGWMSLWGTCSTTQKTIRSSKKKRRQRWR